MVEVLKEPTVGLEDLAEEVESKFIRQSSKDTSVTTDSGQAAAAAGD